MMRGLKLTPVGAGIGLTGMGSGEAGRVAKPKGRMHRSIAAEDSAALPRGHGLTSTGRSTPLVTMVP